MEWIYNDGGRKAAGYRGEVDDCVVRSVAIVTGRPYKEIYNELKDIMQFWQYRKQFTFATRREKSPRFGVSKKITKDYLYDLGFEWTPTMKIGTGCKVHLVADELPSGKLIASVSKHLVAVIDGVIHDTFDPSRDGTRCVYGYWMQASASR